MSEPVTGGCQCGAVRYTFPALGRATICHCRMCQKAFGSFFGPLVTAENLEWTRGAPAWFKSSNKVRRGFCNRCGTPLIYDYGGPLEVSIGSLDKPEAAAPVLQVNPAERLSYFDALHTLPERHAQDHPVVAEFMSDIQTFQHPDHDTGDWKDQS